MKKHKRRGTALICIGLILIAAALAITVYNLYDDFRAASEAEGVLSQINEYVSEQMQKPDYSSSDEKKPDIGSVHPDEPDEKLPDYVLDPYMPMPTLEIDGYSYIGTVTIPPLEIELPIMEQWDYKRMKKSPCRYSGSVYLNDLVVCAHNYRSHFGSLGKLQKNDEIIITDVNGNIFRYRVAQIETLGSRAVEEMTSGDWDLTLFTCTYDGRSRVTVRCMSIDNN